MQHSNRNQLPTLWTKYWRFELFLAALVLRWTVLGFGLKLQCENRFILHIMKRNKTYHYILCNDIWVLTHRLHEKYLCWQENTVNLEVVKVELDTAMHWLTYLESVLLGELDDGASSFSCCICGIKDLKQQEKIQLMQPWCTEHVIRCLIICHEELGKSIKDSPPPVLLRHSGTDEHH